jgi:hypothetical protein
MVSEDFRFALPSSSSRLSPVWDQSGGHALCGVYESTQPRVVHGRPRLGHRPERLAVRTVARRPAPIRPCGTTRCFFLCQGQRSEHYSQEQKRPGSIRATTTKATTTQGPGRGAERRLDQSRTCSRTDPPDDDMSCHSGARTSSNHRRDALGALLLHQRYYRIIDNSPCRLVWRQRGARSHNAAP